jgi:regulator of sigma E protease
VIITIIAFIVIFGLLVFVHELGHFLAAKAIGVEVKTFAFGFPPRIWSKNYKGTEYAINLIPLGGYVSLRGEEEADLSPTDLEKEAKNPSSLISKKPHQLLFVFVSGVLMNILLAITLLYICYLVGFQAIYPEMWGHNGINNDLKVKITSIEKDTPAEKEDLKAGDIIKQINGKDVYLSDQVLSEIRLGDTSQTVDVKIDRNGEILNKKLSTYKSTMNVGGEDKEVIRIGVSLETTGKISGNIWSSLVAAVKETGRIAWLTVVGVVDLFSKIITKFNISDNISGPVGIVLATNYFAHLGLTYLIQFAAILSISLAVFNILPIPALDGGHITFTLLETIFNRKFNSKAKNLIQFIGFGALILLMIAVTIKDVIRLF